MIKLLTPVCLFILHSYKHLWKFIFIIFLFIANHSVMAKQIIITGKTVISVSTIYKDVELNLSNGYFQVVNNATLEIENCTIKGTLSPYNRNLITLQSGALTLKNNRVKVSSIGIPENPGNPSLFDVIGVTQGRVIITGNKFNINKPYTVGLFVTADSYTSGFYIVGNEIHDFHGGFLLKNSHDLYIARNKFTNVSISNIYITEGSNGLLDKNSILFPGNNNVGDGIDVIDSNNIKMENNFIASGSCYSIIILRGRNITVNHNRITAGITYAISIKSSIGETDTHDTYLYKMIHNKMITSKTDNSNQNIKISNNYFSQNRYALTATNVNKLIVINNIFIQRFTSNSERRFWTNNNILMQNVINMNWTKNIYKEAYSQNDSDDNSLTAAFHDFPETGGVSL